MIILRKYSISKELGGLRVKEIFVRGWDEEEAISEAVGEWGWNLI